MLLAVRLISQPASAAAACIGDCDHNGRVTVAEIVRGVNISLGLSELTECPAFDRNDDQRVTVDELVTAVTLALNDCPAEPTTTPSATPTDTPSPPPTATPSDTPTTPPTDTPTPSFTATATDTPTPSPTETASASPTTTPVVNHPPVLPPPAIYPAFAGYEIQLPIGTSDFDGNLVSCTGDGLPDGARVDTPANVLSWTPRADQLGPFYVPVTCTDDGTPPLSVQGELILQVSPLDSCVSPTCNPATGCVGTLPSVQTSCCSGEPQLRLGEAVADCPGGRVVFVGRNSSSGFGRLQNCDRLRVINFLQAGATVRFHVEARCVNTAQPVKIRARLETSQRLLFDAQQAVQLDLRDNGYAQRLSIAFPVGGPTPFFDLEGAEANFSITLTDADGVSVSQRLRLTLTFSELTDLPDVP